MMDGVYWSAATGGFYHERVHGARKIKVRDEAEYERAWGTAEAMDKAEYDATELDAGPDAHELDDTLFNRHRQRLEQNPPMRTIDNPDCTIPVDAVEITAEQHAALIAGQAPGTIIGTGSDGAPALVERVVSPEEALATLRNRRDAALRASDWIEFTRRLPAPIKKKGLAYRDALFDLPAAFEKWIADGKAPADFPFPDLNL